MSQALVVLASEQLWPSLESFLWLARGPGGIDTLFILHSTDTKRSIEPARRFRRLVSALAPAVRVVGVDDPVGTEPAAVASRIRSYMQTMPHDRWTVNATGGTKLMSAGAMSVLDAPGVDVIYRDIVGPWYRLGMTSSSQVPSVDPIAVPAGLGDDLPVADLVRLQFEDVAGSRWESTPAQALPVLEIVRQGIAGQWDWSAIFARAGVAPSGKPGFLFEQFLAGIVVELGVRSVALNMVQVAAGGQVLQEIDVVACSGGRLVIFDAKLRTSEEEGTFVVPLVSQIKDAAVTRRALGGLDARIVMVRPNLIMLPDQRAFAKAERISVVDRSDGPRLISCLADALGRPLTPGLQEAERLVVQSSEAGQRVWGRSFVRGPAGILEPTMSAVMDMDGMASQIMKEEGQDWFAYRHAGIVRIQWRPAGFPGDATTARANAGEAFGRFGDCTATLSSSRKTCLIKVGSMRPESAAELDDWLADCRGKLLQLPF